MSSPCSLIVAVKGLQSEASKLFRIKSLSIAKGSPTPWVILSVPIAANMGHDYVRGSQVFTSSPDHIWEL